MENLLNMSLNMIHIKEENKAIVQIVTEELWLNYFNNYLLKNGVITERMYMKMFLKILQRTSQKKKALNI